LKLVDQIITLYHLFSGVKSSDANERQMDLKCYV